MNKSVVLKTGNFVSFTIYSGPSKVEADFIYKNAQHDIEIEKIIPINDTTGFAPGIKGIKILEATRVEEALYSVKVKGELV